MEIPTAEEQPVNAEVTYARLNIFELKTRPRLLNRTLTFHLILPPSFRSCLPSPRRHARCSVAPLCCCSQWQLCRSPALDDREEHELKSKRLVIRDMATCSSRLTLLQGPLLVSTWVRRTPASP